MQYQAGRDVPSLMHNDIPASPRLDSSTDPAAEVNQAGLPGATIQQDNWITETIIINGLPQTIIFPEG